MTNAEPFFNDQDDLSIEKLKTGIPGFDPLAEGGLPKNRTTLIAGTAGSAKTVFACQFLAAGILASQEVEAGVFVTLEESPQQIRHNMRGLGWKIAQWEAEGKWIFVDASPSPGAKPTITGDYDFEPLLARIEYAVTKVKAKRLAIDSLGAVFSYFTDTVTIRGEIFRVASGVKKFAVTTVMTAERTQEYGNISRYGMEAFVADNVIILRNVAEADKRRRTIEILKFRGATHHKGEYAFTINPRVGIEVIPLSTIELQQKSSKTRITSGIEELNLICGGGFFRDSITLVSGATGTGKTLTVTKFLEGGYHSGERVLLLAFEESHEQLFRNAEGWGVDLAAMEVSEKLKVVCRYPETMGLEDHLIKIKNLIKQFQPHRVAIDSLSSLERNSSEKGFREFVINITAYIKRQEIAGLFTSNTTDLLGTTSVTDAHISTITDTIILLRYVEVFGKMRRAVTILKMRGSQHDKDIREYRIDSQGIQIGKPFHLVTGIISGNYTYVSESEFDRINGMFEDN